MTPHFCGGVSRKRGVKGVKVVYALNKKVIEKAFLEGRQLSGLQELYFEQKELTEKARELWLQLFGASESAVLYQPTIFGGVYPDGSVSSKEPYVGFSGNVYEANKILSAADLESILTEIAEKKAALEAEIPKRREEWLKARQRIEEKKKIEKEAEERRRQRFATLPWVKELIERIALSQKIDDEKARFCRKFGLLEEDLTVQVISDEPFVRLTAIVPVVFEGVVRELKIVNKLYKDKGVDTGEWKKAEFSSLSLMIAEALSEIFNGHTRIVYDYEDGEAWLNVETESDTIEVAKAELERADS